MMWYFFIPEVFGIGGIVYRKLSYVASVDRQVFEVLVDLPVVISGRDTPILTGSFAVTDHCSDLEEIVS